MADDKYYAWGPIRVGKTDGSVGRVPAGTVVTPAKLGVSDADFAEMISSGAVRTLQYPDMPDGYQGSPIDFLRDEVRKMMGGEEGDEAAPMEELLVAGLLQG